MNLYEILGQTENHTVYAKQSSENLIRQLDLLKSLVLSALATGKLFLSQTIIKSLNFHAITCLHDYAGVYRPCEVQVGNGRNAYRPPAHHEVPGLMDDFVNEINRRWKDLNAIELAALVLWRLNYIHPFINGNGRSARAACYFVVCLKYGVWLPGDPILPETLKQHRKEYVDALKIADAVNDKSRLQLLIAKLLYEQLRPFMNSQDPPDQSQPPQLPKE